MFIGHYALGLAAKRYAPRTSLGILFIAPTLTWQGEDTTVTLLANYQHDDQGWGIQFLQSTAAGVSLSGRVTTADGAGIRNARMTITGNSLPEPRVVTTGSFGYYSFDGLTAGETYVVTVNSQRYTFTVPSRVYTIVDNIVDADFTADQ